MSISGLPGQKKYALYNEVSLESRDDDHNVSCRPISTIAEGDMELLSDIVTWGELYLHHFEQGAYACSRCENILYFSDDKFRGPCRWPSFRKSACIESLIMDPISSYNGYTVEVNEIYCKQCLLFIGHSFRDGNCYDKHIEAEWRH